jgi:hypothetical protein
MAGLLQGLRETIDWEIYMHKFIFMLAFTFVSLNSFAADDTIQCDIRIQDNKVRCPLLKKCPQKVLRKSEVQIQHTLNSGDALNDSISLKKVVLFPGTPKQDRNLVFLLQGDDRASELNEAGVDLVEYETLSKLQYELIRAGDLITARFAMQNSSWNFTFNRSLRSGLTGVLYTTQRGIANRQTIVPVYVTCRTTDSSIINDTELEKQIIERHLNQSQNRSSSATQQ